MKNRLTALLVLITLLVSMFAFVGCGNNEDTNNGSDNSGSSDNAGGSNENDDKDEDDTADAEIRQIYYLYVESAKKNNVTPKSYEEWLESIKGADGKDGVTPSFKLENGELFVSYDDEETWDKLGTIKGSDGSAGNDGITPSFKLENGELFVSYDDEKTWDSLGKLVLESEKPCEHNYEEWKNVSAYPCNFLKFAECTLCGEIDLKVDGGHAWSDWQTAEPTCEVPGLMGRICNNCGELETKEYSEPLGHDWSDEYSYDDDGHWIECERCGEECHQAEHVETESGLCEICGCNMLVIYDGSEVTITFYHTMGTKLQLVLEDAIKEFNKRYPNITIEHKQIGTYDDVVDQIKTEITAGNQPNIAYCYPDHVALYNKAGAAAALDGFIGSTAKITDALGNETVFGLTAEQIADFIPGFYAEGAVYDERGTMYTLPMSKSTEALYYNKTFFEKHGLKVPTTWDEMEAVCRQIKEIDPNSIPLGYDSEANWFITMCEQLKSGYTSLDKNNPFIFDNATNREFVERFAGWYKDGLVTTQELYGAYTSALFTEVDSDRTKCYMVIGSTGGASHQISPVDGKGNYIFETGIAMMPQIDPANPKVISQGPSLVIFDDSAYNDITKQEVLASWLFVKFLTTDVEFQAKFSMASGYAPVIKSVQDNETYKEEFLDMADGYSHLVATSVKLALSMADNGAYFVSPAFVGSSVARRQVGMIIVNVLVQYYYGSSTGSLKDIIDAEFKLAMAECNYAIGK